MKLLEKVVLIGPILPKAPKPPRLPKPAKPPIPGTGALRPKLERSILSKLLINL